MGDGFTHELVLTGLRVTHIFCLASVELRVPLFGLDVIMLSFCLEDFLRLEGVNPVIHVTLLLGGEVTISVQVVHLHGYSLLHLRVLHWSVDLHLLVDVLDFHAVGLKRDFLFDVTA